MNLPPACRLQAVTTLCAAFLSIAAGGCEPSSTPADRSIEAVRAALSGASVRAHIEVLASDEMQGREAGTIGHAMAADYVAARFAAIGLDPPIDGGFLQDITFLETRLVPGSESLVLHSGDTALELRREVDYVRSGGFGDTVESVTAPLLFAGFGIQAPEYDHDDYAGVDPAGRILVMFTGAPPRFAPDERAFYSSSTGKQQLAVERGAVGILTIRTPVDQERLTWPRMLAASRDAGMRWLEPANTPHDAFLRLTGDALLSESGAEKLFELAGRDLDALFERHGDGGTGSFEMGVSATLRRQSMQRPATSPNVLALLPGSDLADEYILISAHLDHLGSRDGPDGDTIYNGAYDNAAGVATVLEVAAAMAQTSPSPRRSVVFAAVTAEEKGLRGSDYLAHHPPVAIERIVANINIDMPFLGYAMADVEGFGVEHSTLRDALALAAADVGLSLTPDPRPELVRLIRSDQFSFVKQGVPGLNLKPGNTSSDPAVDGSGLRAAFLQNHYHQPTDDLMLPFAEEGAKLYAQLVFTFAMHVANDDEPPAWIDGDFFGERFDRRARSGN